MKLNKEEMIKQSKLTLQYEGIEWIEFNNGYHFKIGPIDFWPTTGKWSDIKNDINGMGVESLIEFIKHSYPMKTNVVNHLSVQDLVKIATKVKPQNLLSICEAIHKEIYK